MKLRFKRQGRNTYHYIVMINSLGCILQSSMDKAEAKEFPNENANLIHKMVKTFYRMKGEEVGLEIDYELEN